jgi:hypothetical protein
MIFHYRLTDEEFEARMPRRGEFCELLWFTGGIRTLAEFALRKFPILRKPCLPIRIILDTEQTFGYYS